MQAEIVVQARRRALLRADDEKIRQPAAFCYRGRAHSVWASFSGRGILLFTRVHLVSQLLALYTTVSRATSTNSKLACSEEYCWLRSVSRKTRPVSRRVRGLKETSWRPR